MVNFSNLLTAQSTLQHYMQVANCSSGAIWGFSVLLKDTFTYIKLAITK